VERARIRVLLEAVVAGDAAALFGEIERIAEFAPDFAQVLDALAGLLHRIQLHQLKAASADDGGAAALADRIDPREVQLYYQIAVTARRDLPLAPTQRVGFEMAMLRMLAFAPQSIPGVRQGSPGLPSVPRAVAEPLVPSSAGAPRPSSAVNRTQASAHAAPVAATAGPLVIDDWPGLLERCELGGPLGQLALNSVLLACEGDVLRLGLKSAHEHLATPRLVERLGEKLGAALRRPLRVRIERVADAAESPADAMAKSSEARLQQAHEGLHADPAVKSLIDTFGARIIGESVRPLEK
jgi:DNA polymerase-3 subunit gamma/tau